MYRTLLVLVVASTLCGACAAHRTRSSQRSNWASVMVLSTDDQVEVATLDGQRVSGRMIRAEADAVVLGPVAVAVPKANIQSVWTIGRQDSLLNGALLGALAGLALGGLTHATGNEGFVVPASAIAVGSVVGTWTDRGWNGPPRRLVYRRPAP